MYAHQHMEHLPTPLPAKPAPKAITFRHRLLDDNENTTRSPPKKPRTHYYSAASWFDRHRKPTVHDNDSSIDRLRTRRHQLSPSPGPEPPIISELTERYTELRTALHSSIVARLEEAQEELTTQAADSIKARQVALAQLEARSNQLHAPLRTAKIDYEAVGEDGQKRRTTVAIEDAVRALGQKLESATAELDGLWAT
ncbi:hypothetical protein F4775DRAFT_422763 [Biscogniauxia sp. FL1348]|nr:hypothetical protein F4775DRAFT_422763 [Biscogniauxia sp. FL1348]